MVTDESKFEDRLQCQCWRLVEQKREKCYPRLTIDFRRVPQRQASAIRAKTTRESDKRREKQNCDGVASVWREEAG